MPRSSERPNFVFFMPDEMRADAAGCFGQTLDTTPNLDAFADRAVRFQQCHVQHTVCSPSRCSMMTGWYPHVRGHRSLWHLLQPDEPNLLRYLTQAGYDVRWWGKNDLLSHACQKTDVTLANAPEQGVGYGRNPWPKDDPRYYSFLYDPCPGDGSDAHDALCVEEAIRFIESPHDKPFCVYLPLIFPHCPYSAPQPWHDMFSPDDIGELLPSELPHRPPHFEGIRRTRRLDECDEHLFRKIRAVYLGMTRFIDHLFGQLLDALDRTGLTDNTVVVFLADHGDYAGDFGLVEKWTSGLEDCLTHIPLVIRAPGCTPGHAVAPPVEMFDVMPTVLELAGIEPQHTHFAHSLTPQLDGDPGDPERAAFAEGGFAEHDQRCFESWSGRPSMLTMLSNLDSIYHPKIALQGDEPNTITRSAMLRTADHKLVYRPQGRCELYHYADDPREQHNRYDDPALADVRDRLQRRLLDWYVQTADVTPWRDDHRGLTL